MANVGLSKAAIAKLRAETPACEGLLHFNNAGASLMPAPVYAAQTAYQALEQEVGGYEAESAQAELITDFYPAIAGLIGASPHDIAFMDSATRAWHQAVASIPFQAGDRVLMHITEYEANYLTLLHLKAQKGIEIDFVQSDESGQIDVTDLAAKITPRTKLICLSHIPTYNGVINPAAEVGKIARDAGVLYLLDACQSVGQVEIDVTEIRCDMLCATGRKYMRGPRGTGFLYVAPQVIYDLIPPAADSHSALLTGEDSFEFVESAKRFEIYERSPAGMIGLAAAARYASDIGVANIRVRVDNIATTLRRELSTIKGVDVHDWGTAQSGIVTFTKQNHEPMDMMHALRERRINMFVSTPSQIDPNGPAIAAPHLARASVHYFNTKREVSAFCEAVASL
ncbi:MAG: aminotransferase class V-fold PLP-dependent enzyme [Maricaulaceae bacterium]